MTLKFSKRWLHWLCSCAIALGLSASAAAGDLDQYRDVIGQKARPKDPHKKVKKPKTVTQENVRCHVRRHRHHVNYVTTTETKENVSRNVEIDQSGSDNECDEPVNKVMPNDSEPIWAPDTSTGQQQQCDQRRRKMHTKKQTSTVPVRTAGERCRKYYKTRVDTNTTTNEKTDKEEWTSSSEDDPPPESCPKVTTPTVHAIQGNVIPTKTQATKPKKNQ